MSMTHSDNFFVRIMSHAVLKIKSFFYVYNNFVLPSWNDPIFSSRYSRKTVEKNGWNVVEKRFKRLIFHEKCEEK